MQMNLRLSYDHIESYTFTVYDRGSSTWEYLEMGISRISIGKFFLQMLSLMKVKE